MNYSLYSNLLNVNDQGSRAAAIYKYWDLVSDELVQMGPDTGKYRASYVCRILGEDGQPCGVKRLQPQLAQPHQGYGQVPGSLRSQKKTRCCEPHQDGDQRRVHPSDEFF